MTGTATSALSTPDSVMLRASRLRLDDVLVTREPITVARPPVISEDGATVALVTRHEDGTHHLAVLPVDQPVRVARPYATRTPIRSSRVARSSGASIEVLDLAAPGSNVPAVGKEQWATLCTHHQVLAFYTSVSTAEARASHPEEWCSNCSQATRERAYGRLRATPATRRA